MKNCETKREMMNSGKLHLSTSARLKQTVVRSKKTAFSVDGVTIFLIVYESITLQSNS